MLYVSYELLSLDVVLVMTWKEYKFCLVTSYIGWGLLPAHPKNFLDYYTSHSCNFNSTFHAYRLEYESHVHVHYYSEPASLTLNFTLYIYIYVAFISSTVTYSLEYICTCIILHHVEVSYFEKSFFVFTHLQNYINTLYMHVCVSLCTYMYMLTGYNIYTYILT